MINPFAREPQRPHLRIANDIEDTDGVPRTYPFPDLQAMAEIRMILEPYAEDDRVRILKYVVEVLNLPGRPE